MNDARKLLLSRAEDLIKLCQRRASAQFSAFLDGGELLDISEGIVFPADINVSFFGGASHTERKILGVFPEWEEPEDEAFPISVLKIESRYDKLLSHRDYLGVLMSQGIDRSKIGDITVDGGMAYVFVCTDIAEYLADNIVKIGNQGVSCEVCDLTAADIPEPKTEEMGAVCASLRLDSVVSAVCGQSRAAAAKLIAAERVKVNHRETDNASYNLKDNDLVSVRGFGRFRFCTADGKTRKGRLHITVKKYI